jgi:hypothetical protein
MADVDAGADDDEDPQAATAVTDNAVRITAKALPAAGGTGKA